MRQHAISNPMSLGATVAEIAFGLPEVQQWAEFSGDFNPIHFDEKQARGAGLDGLVVHGMLALLPVKAAMAQAASQGAGAAHPEAPGSRWMKFQALFRSPIPHDSNSLLTLRPAKAGGTDFRLHAGDTHQERFRGSFMPVAELGPWHDTQSLSRHAFSVLLPEQGPRFAQSYPHIRHGWIAIDAIVFADFMRTKLDEIAHMVRQDFARMLSAHSGASVFVQTSHSVYVDMHALQELGPWPFDGGQLSYAMALPEIVASGDKVIGCVALPVMQGGNLIMRVEIGLLAKPAIQLHNASGKSS